MTKKVVINTEITKDRLQALCNFTTYSGVAGNTVFNVYPSPTANCQVFSISSFVNIFPHLDPNLRERSMQSVYIPTRKGSKKMKINTKWYNEDGTSKVEYDVNAFMKIMQAAVRSIGNKNMMLIDIRNTKLHIDFIDKNLASDIVFKQPYKSTNGSNMVIYLIKTESIKRYK